ncbi:hypothetical protein [Tardiphaga sp. P5_C10]
MSSSGDFSDDEIVVRVLRTPHFYKRGALTSAAFRPQREKLRLSTIRWLDREEPDRDVKTRCAQIGNIGKNTYWGVAKLTAGDFFAARLELDYTPHEYPGHTDVVFPFALPESEPLEGEKFIQQSEIADQLIRKARAIEDPNPGDVEWTIPSSELCLARR